MYQNVSRCIKMIVILPMHVTCTCTACNNHEHVCTVCVQMSITPARRCYRHKFVYFSETCNPDPPPVQNTFGSKPDSPFQNPQYTSSRGLFGHHRGNNGSYIGRHQVTATISHHKVLNVKIICTIFRSHFLPISPLYIMFGRPTGPNKNYDTLPLNVYILQGEPVYGVPASLKSNTSEHSEVKN